MKKKASISIALVLFYFLALSKFNVYAHEIFENGSPDTAVELELSNTTSSGDVWLKVDCSGLKNPLYKDNISAIYNWNNIVVNSKINRKVIVTQESPWNANVRYIEDNIEWEKLGMPPGTFALTVLFDTKSRRIDSYGAAKKSTGKIQKAYIYMNTNTFTFGDGYITKEVVCERVRKTISHELGHVLGLGHPDREWYNPLFSLGYSVMRQGTPDYVNTGEKVGIHDKVDLIFKYK